MSAKVVDLYYMTGRLEWGVILYSGCIAVRSYTFSYKEYALRYAALVNGE